jgi:hypothetical protein
MARPFRNKHVAEAPKHDIRCDYCDRLAERVNGKAIYPHRPDLVGKQFWRCQPCGAYVGCHPGTSTPLGRLANAQLRRAKQQAHAAFDPIWRSKERSRGEAYAWLAEQLGISKNNCHIGMFDVEMCERVVSVCTPPRPEAEP